MIKHQTVFLTQAIDYLQIQAQHWYLDATFGAGGHSQEIIRRGGNVIAFEYDRQTYDQAQKNFADLIKQKRLCLFCANFIHLRSQIQKLTFLPAKEALAGIIFDLGTNSEQLMSGERGLSVYKSGPLDMRLDQNLAVSARDLLLVLSAEQLSQMFWLYGGEKQARAIAQAIISYRQKKGPQAFIESHELTRLVAQVKKKHTHLHPATKVFQALRIVVNNEIANLERALPEAWQVLAPGGRLVVLAFHEGEDRPVKNYFRQHAQLGQGLLVTKKPIQPDSQELHNRRSRSVKMRVIEKIK